MLVAEFRVDPETRDWHIVAPGRASRPVDGPTTTPGRCPFCPGNESMTPPEILRVPTGSRPWRVRVVPNRYALVTSAPPPQDVGGSAFAATGEHEVVVESPHHDWDLPAASAQEAAEILSALRARCQALARRRPAAVVAFRNHGAAAGTSLHHPHSQIVALDQAPPGLRRRWDNARRSFLSTGRCLHEDTAAAERAAGTRVVEDGDGVLVYQPAAASVPHETVVLPMEAAPDLAAASDDSLGAVARVLPRLLAGLAAVCDNPAYNLVVHAGPTGDDSAGDWYRWHIGLYPRVTHRAGLERATGLSGSPTAPEHTAPALRRAMRRAPTT